MPAAFDSLSATALRSLVASRQVSPVDLVRRALDKAEATQASLNAFVVLRPEPRWRKRARRKRP